MIANHAVCFSTSYQTYLFGSMGQGLGNYSDVYSRASALCIMPAVLRETGALMHNLTCMDHGNGSEFSELD